VGVVNPIESYWWLLFWPSAFLALTLFSLNFVGDGLRDALDPKTLE
jgi:ABC-type dipeptide/oligopeptide/nickel transport system permease subunit